MSATKYLFFAVLFVLLNSCAPRGELGKHYITWSVGLVGSGIADASVDSQLYLRDVRSALMESLSDEMRRYGTRDLDKIVWIEFQIDETGGIDGVEIVRSDSGAFVATLCESAVRRARKPPVMPAAVAAELGSPLELVAVFEFNRPET